jgi:hypothetical protein
MACCCTFGETVDQQFTSKKAIQELERYRRKGAGPTTRLLIEGISQAGIANGTLLDVGAGVGALTFELLKRGIRRAVIVEASAGYRAAAADEATRRGRANVIDFVSGDLLDVSGTIPVANVVALDLRLTGVERRKPGQGLVQSEDVDTRHGLRRRNVVDADRDWRVRVALPCMFSPPGIDDHHAHRAGGQRHEVVPIHQVRTGPVSESQIDLVHERGCAQRFARPKTTNMAACQNPELVIHEAKQFVDGSVSTLAPTRARAIDVVIILTHGRAQRRL